MATPVLYEWSRTSSFGVPVIRGALVDGRWITRPILWVAHGYLGCYARPYRECFTNRFVKGDYRLHGVERPARQQDGK